MGQLKVDTGVVVNRGQFLCFFDHGHFVIEVDEAQKLSSIDSNININQ